MMLKTYNISISIIFNIITTSTLSIITTITALNDHVVFDCLFVSALSHKYLLKQSMMLKTYNISISIIFNIITTSTLIIRNIQMQRRARVV